jgi:hypothetical protein
MVTIQKKVTVTIQFQQKNKIVRNNRCGEGRGLVQKRQKIIIWCGRDRGRVSGVEEIEEEYLVWKRLRKSIWCGRD